MTGGWGGRISGGAFFRTSPMAHRQSHVARRPWLAFDLAGSAAPSLFTLGRLAEETFVSPLAPQTVLRVRQGEAANAAHVLIWPTAAPLVRNSPRGWTPRSLTTIRLSWGESRCVVRSPAPATAAPRPMRKRLLVPVDYRSRPSRLCLRAT